MRTLFFIIMVPLCLSTVVSAELSVEDLDKIRQIVKESEGRLEKRISDIHTQLDERITDQNERFDFQGTLIVTLIGAVIVFVGIPLILIAYQQNRRTQQDDIIKDDIIKGLTAEIQTLRERIESLEEKRIVGA